MLGKILCRRKSSFVEKASFAMMGIYAGFLPWYAVTRYERERMDDYGMFVFLLSVFVCACLAYPMILFCAGSRLFAVQMFSACLAVSCLTDFAVILLLVLSSSMGTGRIAGYVFAMLQSVLRLALPVFAGNIIAFLFIHPDLPEWTDRISPAHMLRYTVPSAAVLGMLTAIVFKYRYSKGYINIQMFYVQYFFLRDL